MTTFLTFLSAGLYLILVLVTISNKNAIKVNGRVVDNAFARALLAIAVWPVIALVFWLFGLISQFMLLPLTALF